MSEHSVKITQQKNATQLQAFLVGQIDEDAVYPQWDLEGVAAIDFDMGQISLINSTGIQGWVRFMASLPDDLSLTFSNCPIRVIGQLNLFPDFFAGKKVQITSFFAPYFCEPCDKTQPVLLHLATDFANATKLQAPEKGCPTCGQMLEFDGLEKKYFQFLSELG